MLDHRAHSRRSRWELSCRCSSSPPLFMLTLTWPTVNWYLSYLSGPVRAWCQGLLLYSSLLSTHASTRTHVRTPTHAYKNLEPGVAPSCTHLGKRRKSVQKANVAWKTFLALLNELWLNFKGRGKQWNLAEIMPQFLMIRVAGSILSLGVMLLHFDRLI